MVVATAHQTLVLVLAEPQVLQMLVLMWPVHQMLVWIQQVLQM